MARPLRHPWAFFELWWRPWLFCGEGDAVWAHTIGENWFTCSAVWSFLWFWWLNCDFPMFWSTFLCGSDNSLAAFSCFGLLFLEFPMTWLRLSFVLVYFSLHFRWLNCGFVISWSIFLFILDDLSVAFLHLGHLFLFSLDKYPHGVYITGIVNIPREGILDMYFEYILERKLVYGE